MRLAAATLLFGIASALIPVINIEAYLGFLATQDEAPILSLSVLGSLGQMIGKVAWFYAGDRSMSLPWIQRKLEKPSWRATYDRWHRRIADRPWFAGGVCFLSAVTGLPPFAVIAVLVGQLKMNLLVFLVTGFVGRAVRFYAVLAGVSFLVGH